MNPLSAYTRWLHSRWPAGTVEKLPRVKDDYTCNVPGVYVTGDLTGVPLLKFSIESGVRAVRAIAADPALPALREKTGGAQNADVPDVCIIGGGLSGMAAAVEAKAKGLSFVVLEATRAFSTIVDFPARKPIFTYPNDMTPAGTLQVTAQVKEELVEELERQVRDAGIATRDAFADHIERRGDLLAVMSGEKGATPLMARRVIVAIGRSGNFRRLGVPGEDRERVYNRLHDPRDFTGQNVLVVGGGDSALEAAIALAQYGAFVTLSYRKPEFSRPKPDNVEALNKLLADPGADVAIEHPSSDRVTTSTGRFMKSDVRTRGSVSLMMPSSVVEIRGTEVVIADKDRKQVTLPNDAVFTLIGRAAPLDFFRKSGIAIHGETKLGGWIAFAVFLLFCALLYNWKSGGALTDAIAWGPEEAQTVFPRDLPQVAAGWGAWWADRIADRSTLLGTTLVSMKGNSFYYTFLYSAAIVCFGIARIRRRRTPYVTLQTSVLMAVQVVPLFLLPEILLPWMGYNGWFDTGSGRTLADNLFPLYISAEDWAIGNWPDWGHPRAYWQAYGLILAWPLNVYNVFTEHPQVWWLVICAVQTFVLIPAMIFFWGKGAYCGWICSCGALAETMGDTQRAKMPHGPFWNRLNMAGQFILGVAFVLLGLRIWGWVYPDGWVAANFKAMVEGKTWDNDAGKNVLVNPASYKWWVDIFLGGIIGVGLYFKYSGRVWCRFFCPLAALMHIYARFSRFRIFAEKKKCISCNVCTSVCHQGIDIMNFANKGLPMEDPECVRCSACVQSCPTGVLSFGQIARDGSVLRKDSLAASPVLMREK